MSRAGERKLPPIPGILLRLPKDETVRLALQRQQAAEALGMSLDSFERHVQPELRVVRRGSMRLFLVSDLEQWLEDNASRTLAQDRGQK